MSDVKAKMHQIRFPLRLRPSPCWGSLQRSPSPLAVFKVPTSKSFTHKMAVKTSWHRYGTKYCHCHPVYSDDRSIE